MRMSHLNFTTKYVKVEKKINLSRSILKLLCAPPPTPISTIYHCISISWCIFIKSQMNGFFGRWKNFGTWQWCVLYVSGNRRVFGEWVHVLVFSATFRNMTVFRTMYILGSVFNLLFYIKKVLKLLMVGQ